MIKTYCGKECGQCIEKRLHECDGCSDCNGKKKSDSCVIAQCCEEKQHITCERCGEKTECVTYHSIMTKDAPILGRWINILFWLIVPSLIASILTSESVANLVPMAELAGKILSVASTVIYGLILIRLSAAHSQYKIAGICYLVLQALSVIRYIINTESVWGVVLSLVIVGVSLLCEYNEIDAHSNVLEDIDDELAAKWYYLWIANIAMVCGIVVGTFLALVSLKIGALILLVVSICSIVIGILKLLYLYRTSKAFKKICAQ